ncbi:MAG TPA: hypothetical protein VFK38_05360 [Candidatus Limnocylindrales bacterium]|nr:hypothetical protein [Candidatus Limnocylindrales bacterium]
MNPTQECPWPGFLDPVLESIGVEKCLPNEIAWTDGDGIRIVTDPLVGTGGTWGKVTFWCETKTGFVFQVLAGGLDPVASYAVTATDGTSTHFLATLHTDVSGAGKVGGVHRLPPGGYEWVIHVGTVLSSPGTDEAGFLVFP